MAINIFTFGCGDCFYIVVYLCYLNVLSVGMLLGICLESFSMFLECMTEYILYLRRSFLPSIFGLLNYDFKIHLCFLLCP